MVSGQQILETEVAKSAREVPWEWDLQSDKITFSPNVVEVIGAALPAEITRSKLCAEWIHPDDRSHQQKTADDAIAKCTNYVSQFRIILPDTGAIVWLENHALAVCDSTGKPTGFRGSAINITLRRRVEEALRQSQERLSLTIAAANLGLWEWDAATEEEVWSPRAFEILGLGPGTPANYQRLLKAIHPEDRDRIDRAVRTAMERHEDFDAEFRTVWPNGTVHHVAARGRAFYDPSGRPTRRLGVVMDITQRKLAEQQLAQQAMLLDLTPFPRAEFGLPDCLLESRHGNALWLVTDRGPWEIGL
jgi:PAS domain S-box-containing protein